MTVPMQVHLEAAGLVEPNGLWGDADEVVGAVASPLGVFVGWVDVAWTGHTRPSSNYGISSMSHPHDLSWNWRRS